MGVDIFHLNVILTLYSNVSNAKDRSAKVTIILPNKISTNQIRNAISLIAHFEWTLFFMQNQNIVSCCETYADCTSRCLKRGRIPEHSHRLL